PVDVALHLALVGARGAAARFGVVFTMDRGDVAGRILVDARAAHDERIAQAHFRAGRQAEVALFRRLLEVVALDPELARKRRRAPTSVGIRGSSQPST